jgi:hypothetical protein
VATAPAECAAQRSLLSRAATASLVTKVAMPSDTAGWRWTPTADCTALRNWLQPAPNSGWSPGERLTHRSYTMT